MDITNARGIAVNGGRRVFAFHGRPRQWRPAKGLPSPAADKRFVVHSIPGRCVATGKTLGDAVRTLIAILETTMHRAGPDRDAWWQSQLSAMSDVDRDLFKGIIVDAASRGHFTLSQDGCDLFMFRVDDGDGDVLDGSPEPCATSIG